MKQRDAHRDWRGVRRTAYSKKGEFVMDYACTLADAIECGRHGMIEGHAGQLTARYGVQMT